MRDMNCPRTIANARAKIDQLRDARSQGDLVYRHAAALGWLSALCAECLVDGPTFRALTGELDAVHREMGDALPTY